MVTIYTQYIGELRIQAKYLQSVESLIFDDNVNNIVKKEETFFQTDMGSCINKIIKTAVECCPLTKSQYSDFK